MSALIPAWENGTLVARDKLDVHRRGLRHPAVSVFLLDGRKMLLQRRARTKYHTPGLWANACCTHPYWGETAASCAERRLEQELGLNGLPLVYRGQVEYRAPVGPDMTEHEVVELFTASVDAAGIHPTLNPDEVDEVRWSPIEALTDEIARLPDTFTPWLRIYLQRHDGLIFGDS